MTCPPFVRKNFAIVSDESSDSIITWSASGKSFVILNPRAFEKQILPLYFKHNNINSYVRQLNTYQFAKVSASMSVNGSLEFSHPHFQKDRADKLAKIQRRKRKRNTEKPSPLTNSSDSVGTLLNLCESIQRSEDRLRNLQQELEGVKDSLQQLRTQTPSDSSIFVHENPSYVQDVSFDQFPTYQVAQGQLSCTPFAAETPLEFFPNAFGDLAELFSV
uniref:HSF-type DNA-binding domain-containing protein n=1 Tax=Vannella robusta TaxID=1487602 RepID=A0A7S4ID02_9EUKA|mmetsp:Transcript_2384/g.2928  ORF Transcript_2384/g.2928 Transcript_2384/m.2928 type:complete len:218 (+) Transcript_2384:666-1319(+)